MGTATTDRTDRVDQPPGVGEVEDLARTGRVLLAVRKVGALNPRDEGALLTALARMRSDGFVEEAELVDLVRREPTVIRQLTRVRVAALVAAPIGALGFYAVAGWAGAMLGLAASFVVDQVGLALVIDRDLALPAEEDRRRARHLHDLALFGAPRYGDRLSRHAWLLCIGRGLGFVVGSVVFATVLTDDATYEGPAWVPTAVLVAGAMVGCCFLLAGARLRSVPLHARERGRPARDPAPDEAAPVASPMNLLEAPVEVRRPRSTRVLIGPGLAAVLGVVIALGGSASAVSTGLVLVAVAGFSAARWFRTGLSVGSQGVVLTGALGAREWSWADIHRAWVEPARKELTIGPDPTVLRPIPNRLRIVTSDGVDRIVVDRLLHGDDPDLEALRDTISRHARAPRPGPPRRAVVSRLLVVGAVGLILFGFGAATVAVATDPTDTTVARSDLRPGEGYRTYQQADGTWGPPTISCPSPVEHLRGTTDPRCAEEYGGLVVVLIVLGLFDVVLLAMFVHVARSLVRVWRERRALRRDPPLPSLV